VTIEMRNVISFVQIRGLGDEDSGAVILSRREYSTAIDSGEGLYGKRFRACPKSFTSALTSYICILPRTRFDVLCTFLHFNAKDCGDVNFWKYDKQFLKFFAQRSSPKRSLPRGCICATSTISPLT